LWAAAQAAAMRVVRAAAATRIPAQEARQLPVKAITVAVAAETLAMIQNMVAAAAAPAQWAGRPLLRRVGLG
jgi:hypothetical protein